MLNSAPTDIAGGRAGALPARRDRLLTGASETPLTPGLAGRLRAAPPGLYRPPQRPTHRAQGHDAVWRARSIVAARCASQLGLGEWVAKWEGRRMHERKVPDSSRCPYTRAPRQHTCHDIVSCCQLRQFSVPLRPNTRSRPGVSTAVWSVGPLRPRIACRRTHPLPTCPDEFLFPRLGIELSCPVARQPPPWLGARHCSSPSSSSRPRLRQLSAIDTIGIAFEVHPKVAAYQGPVRRSETASLAC